MLRDDTSYRPQPPVLPPHRRLRVYAFDPGVSLDVDAAFINEVTLAVPWEQEIPPDPDGGSLTGDRPRELLPGPIGEYVEVIDVDPASGQWYEPVNLNDPALLAQDGHAPSEGNPQFHQQMVYAVVMKTVRQFEQTLGRRVCWRDFDPTKPSGQRDRWVPRLRVYPHALREANAYYSPGKAALLFGYFPAGGESASVPGGADVGRNLPGGTVFTCLSHDVIAHETTHAILDGLHRRFMEASNPDVLAFHEAFADLVALFQHFTFPEVVRHQIAITRGDLSAYSMLGQLARQFGEATGHRGALRDAIGHIDRETGKWEPHPADPAELMRTMEPHQRGAVLVAAVFDAFVQIYRRRTVDLYRIATGGTGVLPEGALHPDLVNRLATEATKAAEHLLRICIRALDYCPPVDITFGEFLRALLTADFDLVPDDPLAYRLVLVDAFRRRGIFPPGVRSLSVDSLLWAHPIRQANLKDMMQTASYLDLAGQKLQDILAEISLSWDIRTDRYRAWEQARQNRERIHKWLVQYLRVEREQQAILAEWGLWLGPDEYQSITRDERGRPKVEVHAARPAWRVRKDGTLGLDLVVELTQKRAGYFDQATQERADSGQKVSEPDFWFRGGCTLLVDAGSGEVRYSIRKDITSERRLLQQRQFCLSPFGASTIAARFRSDPTALTTDEPFALLHNPSF